MTKKAAAIKYGIPRATIQYRSGAKFKSPGYWPSTVLTSEEEEILVRYSLMFLYIYSFSQKIVV